MKSVTISASKMAKLHKLAKQMPQLTKVAGLLQKAEDVGNLGPEEVKDIAEDTKQILLSVVEMVDEIVEGVPVEEVTEEITEEVTEEPTEPEIPMVQGQEEDDKDKKENNEKIAKLQNEIKLMKEASTHKELTAKYGQVFPEHVRAAREKEFGNSKQSIQVLEARIKEASGILSDRKAVKVAQLSTAGETFFEDDDYSDDALNFKGVF